MADHVIIVILLIVFFTSTFADKPNRSPGIWMAIGLVIIITHGIAAWNWHHSPLLDTRGLDPDTLELVTKNVRNEFLDSILFTAVGILITVGSIYKWAKKKTAKET